MLMDAVIRLASAAAIRWWPGLPYYGLTVVLFSGVLAALGALVGVFQLAIARQIGRRGGRRVLRLALGMMGGAFIVLAIVSFGRNVSPSTTGRLMAAEALVQALAFGVILVGSRCLVNPRVRSRE